MGSIRVLRIFFSFLGPFLPSSRPSFLKQPESTDSFSYSDRIPPESTTVFNRKKISSNSVSVCWGDLECQIQESQCVLIKIIVRVLYSNVSDVTNRLAPITPSLIKDKKRFTIL